MATVGLTASIGVALSNGQIKPDGGQAKSDTGQTRSDSGPAKSDAGQAKSNTGPASFSTGQATKAKSVPPASIAGDYRRTSPALGELKLTPVGDEWRIEVSGWADVKPVWRTPGKCRTVAVGPYRDGRIVAKLVPFNSEEIVLSEEDVSSWPGEMIVEVGAGRAVVVRSEGDRYCGMFSDLTGTYVLGAKAPAEDRAPAVPSGAAIGKSREVAMRQAWSAALRPANSSGSCRAKIGDKAARALANLCKANAFLYAGACEPDAECAYLAQEAWRGCRISGFDPAAKRQSRPDPKHLPCADVTPWEDWDIYEQ